MKDLTHYFQSPATAAKKAESVANGTDAKKSEKSNDKKSTESPPTKTNKTSKESASKKRKVLSLKRATENGESKDKKPSKENSSNKNSGSGSSDNDSPSPKKRHSSSKRSSSSSKSKSENLSKKTWDKVKSVSVKEPALPCPDKEENKVSLEKQTNTSSSKPVQSKNICNHDNRENLTDNNVECGVSEQGKNDINASSDVEMMDANDSKTTEKSQDLFVEIEARPENEVSSANAESSSKQAKYKNEDIKETATKIPNKKDPGEVKPASSDDVAIDPLISEITFEDECSEEEGKILKKRKLETEAPTPKNTTEVHQGKKPNAFQFMMSSSSKKTTRDTKKKDDIDVSDMSPKETDKLKCTKSSKKDNESADKKTKDASPATIKTPSSRRGRKPKENDKQIESPDVFKDKKEKHKKESEKKSKKMDDKKEKEMKPTEKTVEKETSKTKEVDDTPKTGKLKKSDTLDTEKSPDAFKFLMSSQKQSKSTEKLENSNEEEEVKKPKPSRGKRKNVIASDDSDEHETEEEPKPQIDSASKPKPSGLLGYFSPVSRDEARKRAAEILVTKTVTAEVHQIPDGDSPEENKRHSMGPRRRSHRSTKHEEEEEIIVLSVEDAPEEIAKPVKKPFKFKTPEKKKKRRPWQLKVRLISPAKPVEDLSDSSENSCTDSDSDCMEITESPMKKQTNLKSLWAARGKEMRLAPIFASKSKNTSKQTNVEDSKSCRKIKTSVAMPLMRPAPTEHTIGFVEIDSATPMSVLFPSISHVTQTESSTEPKSEFKFPPTPAKEIICWPAILPGSLISASEPNQEIPASVQKAITEKTNANGNGESWCDKHRPCLVADLAGNGKSVDRLKAWLEGWRQRSTISDDRSQKSSDSESSDYSSGDDFIVSDDESSREGQIKKKKKKKHCNTALLVGPCGSGKTAAVYAAAEELGFKVLEMNASSRRSGKRILSELQEATQSHQVRNNAVDQETLNSFFGSSKGKEKNNDPSAESQQQTTNNSGLSLILVEDVDVVFEEQDEGFLAALNVLAASSKRPLILVSNEPQCPLLLARQHRLHLEFKKVPVTITGDVVKRICSKEGETVADSQLQHLMKTCNGDLRRAVLLAQTWTLTGGFPQLPPSRVLPFPLNLSELWAAMKHVPLPFILTEDEVAEEEEVEESKTQEDSDDENIFSPVKKKKLKARRQRLTSDSLDKWEPTQQATSCPDLKKMQWFSDMLATLDVMQGCNFAELNFSCPRPGLSDQPCHKAVPDCVGPRLQHWLASKAAVAGGCTLSFHTSEQRDKWKEAHRGVDEALLEQLPLTGQLDRCAAALDLLPALRDLGRSEQSSGRVSRRSRINALNSLGFHPGGIVIETLPFIFPDTEPI